MRTRESMLFKENPQEHYDLFKGVKSMNYVLALRSMNLFCTNCQEALHPVYEGRVGVGGVGRGLQDPQITGAPWLKAAGPTVAAIDLQMSRRRLINGGLMRAGDGLE